jgi:hypothetical protein
MNLRNLVLLSAFAPLAIAAPIGIWRNTSADLHVADELHWDAGAYGSCAKSASGTAPGSTQCSLTVSDSGYFYDLASGEPYRYSITGQARSFARVAYGSVAVSTATWTTGSDSSPWAAFDIAASGGFTDQVTVLGIDSGFVQYHVRGIGAAMTDPPGEPVYFQLQHGGKAAEGLEFYTGAINGEYDYTSALYPFTGGIPFEIQLWARAGTYGVGDLCGGSYVTAELYRIDVFNSNKQPAPARLVSQAKASYAVPEPGSFLMFAGGIGAVLLLRRQRR